MLNYTIQVAEQPTEEPVSAQELYDHLSLNVALNAVEDLLTLYIIAAREQFESLTDGRAVCPTVYTQHLPCFPDNGCPVKLYRGQVLTVDAITYYDEDEVQQTLTGWGTDLTGIPALVSKPDDGFPSVSTTKPRPITIEFTAGWEDVDAVPQSVKLAIMLLAAHYYNVRETISDVQYVEVPMGFKRICDQWKTGIGGV